ncbi:MAG: phosphatidylserine decarboxylase family protein [Ignavibacteriae bacterium]|nr:phosphatidylserine decarboxylase family protein [Ignavibacteriota bacterium]
MITHYGLDVVVKFFIIAVLIVAATFFFTQSGAIRYIIFSIVGLATIFVLNFFRDPDRTTPPGNNIVVSPADGKVVLIKEFYEDEYLKCDAVQVSVFMSPLNVHVNRFPISGQVGYFRYIQGEYLVAFEDKSSERNERTHIGVESNGYKVLFKQIAGAVARRIVAPITVGQLAVMGERFGMIKFGSRVDVIMPKGTHINVKLNEHVVAGESVLATFTPKPTSEQ